MKQFKTILEELRKKQAFILQDTKIKLYRAKNDLKIEIKDNEKEKKKYIDKINSLKSELRITRLYNCELEGKNSKLLSDIILKDKKINDLESQILGIKKIH
jgi:ABC-type phosphate transport system auxiliary subunit